MLDKSVPFAKLYMRRKAGTPIPEFKLPDGFKYVFYSDGDDADWAKIETSVDEFDSEFAALLLFKEDFMPYADELYRRCLFIETDSGEKVATANAWWSFVDDERRAWLHWVSVKCGFQGLGLGKAITSRVTELLRELEGDTDFYLSTQTWSYKAINIYKKCGYEPTDEKILYGKKYKTHYKKALKILDKLQLNR
jgi:ribosomal protein S18 acetylase RimI-like enzyme